VVGRSHRDHLDITDINFLEARVSRVVPTADTDICNAGLDQLGAGRAPTMFARIGPNYLAHVHDQEIEIGNMPPRERWH
jgi:hypothetical protein